MGDDNATSETATDQAPKQTRFRSEIEFPYSDLASTIELARKVRSRAGTTACTETELAAWMDQTVTGGTFRSRLSAARLFGLIETSQGRVSLTQLGREVCDEAKLHDAKVEAFLNPPLFGALYERFLGHVLPPAAAIERQIEELGVSPKQKERARQAFIKSAQHAGYVDPATGRFVKPGAAQAATGVKKSDRGEHGGGNGGDPPTLDPLIAALIQKLPPAKTPTWPAQDRVMWLQMTAMAFQMAYGSVAPIEIKLASSQTDTQTRESS